MQLTHKINVPITKLPTQHNVLCCHYYHYYHYYLKSKHKHKILKVFLRSIRYKYIINVSISLESSITMICTLTSSIQQTINIRQAKMLHMKYRRQFQVIPFSFFLGIIKQIVISSNKQRIKKKIPAINKYLKISKNVKTDLTRT